MKRIFDFSFALIVLILVSPLMGVLALVIRLKLGSPVLYKQIRPGRGGGAFCMYKFRSMSNEVDASGALLADNLRLSRLGNWLRSTSLDELPSLWSVVKGDMSMVGPRPLLMEYLPLYTKRQARRQEVRPGITGWAQINGRNDLAWEKKFELDVWYVENQSLILDLKILAITILKVLQRDGISHKESATMPRFEGSKVDG